MKQRKHTPRPHAIELSIVRGATNQPQPWIVVGTNRTMEPQPQPWIVAVNTPQPW